MSTTDLETYNGQLARLDRHYILALADEIGLRLRVGGEVVATNYEPGNGTRYSLIFTPVAAIEQSHRDMVPAGLRDSDGEIRPGWTVVAKCNCTDSDWVYPFDLGAGNAAHVGYVANKARCNIADATAYTALFRAITGTNLEDAE